MGDLPQASEQILPMLSDQDCSSHTLPSLVWGSRSESMVPVPVLGPRRLPPPPHSPDSLQGDLDPVLHLLRHNLEIKPTISYSGQD